MAKAPKAEAHDEAPCDPPDPAPDDPPPAPDPHTTGVERYLWDVPHATYATVVMTDAELEAALAAGTYQDLGDRYLVDGLGQPAPPLALSLMVGEADYRMVAITISGGSALQSAVTLYFGDGTYERRDGSGSGDLTHKYAEPGMYQISAINDFGQQAYKFVTIGVEDQARAKASADA